MWPILLEKLPFILMVLLVLFLLLTFFPIVYFLIIVVPFLMLKTAYHSLVKYIHEHNLWWDIPLFLIIILSIILVILLFNGYRY